MPYKTPNQENMDDAADKASAELKDGIQSGAISTALDLANWLKNNYMECGYKRLGRVIIETLRNGWNS